MDYGIRVELIAKVQGASRAADYFATIPKAFQTAMVYSILLTAYVEQNKEKEALKLLQKVEKLGLGHQTYMYNQLLYLYKKNGVIAGVAEVLKTMEEKRVEPNIYTYNLILDVRARKGDICGMEKVWDQIKANDALEADAATYSILAKGYMIAGRFDKAEKMAEKIGQSPFSKKRIVHLMLLRLYGDLGKEDQLDKIWNSLCQGPRIGRADYVTMIRSLGKIGSIERAEDLFDEMEEKIGNLTVHNYNSLLSVYARAGKVQRGEHLMKKMAKAKLQPNTGTYHELVQMYLKAGQEQKAMEILEKRSTGRFSKNRLLYSTYQAALECFAEKGNVKEAEKVVRDLKLAGYSCAYRSYIVLLKAYENGFMSPYGFLDRLQSDKVIPNNEIRQKLKKLEGT
ncbi:hypothetical protein KP509_17G065300 [Ceratopteris richardii]|nr:hypothetical protein KP509_17G065300 [Ceratopteris richardii]